MPAGTATAWLIPDLDAFARTFDIYSNTGMFALGSITNAAARGNNRCGHRRGPWRLSTGGFSFDSAIPVRGDIGVRYAHTEQTSQGYLPAGGAPVLLTEVHEYSDLLPSMNLVVRIHAGLAGAFRGGQGDDASGAGQVTPGGTTSLVGNLGVATGNPFLEPNARQDLRPGGGMVLR